MRWKLFADLAEVAGASEVIVEVPSDEPTAGDGLTALFEACPLLEDRVLTDEGDLEPHLNLLQNGENIGETGLSTPVEPDDELALFPPVSGG